MYTCRVHCLGVQKHAKLEKGSVSGHIDKFWKRHDGQIEKNTCKNAYLGSIFMPEKYVFGVARYNWPTALAVRPDVLNAKYHFITNTTHSYHNRDPVPYQRSSNTSQILKLERYYAVIISRCGKLWMQIWRKTVLAALTKTSKFEDINGSVDKGRRKNVSE